MSENLTNCKNCIHYDYHNSYKDFGLCKRYKQNVSAKYVCRSFLPYVSDLITQKSESKMPEKTEPKVMQNDPVNPSYYRNGKVSCIDAMESATVNKKGLEAVSVAMIIKYLWRYEEKGGLEDVQKGKWYYERLLNILENKNND